MKILVVSDTHGDLRSLEKILAAEKPDTAIHLGDHAGDMERARLPENTDRVIILPGNCDFSARAPEVLAEIGGKKVFMLHGHTRNVKSGLLSVTLAARERGADILLFGHTHLPFSDQHNGLLTINPGSAKSRGGAGGSYALIRLLDENTPPEWEMKQLF